MYVKTTWDMLSEDLGIEIRDIDDINAFVKSADNRDWLKNWLKKLDFDRTEHLFGLILH